MGAAVGPARASLADQIHHLSRALRPVALSLPLAEHYAEVEPFKTAIVLKFQREWPFVLFAVALLGAGLFVERFYCRYLCPLGAALAIPAQAHLRLDEALSRMRLAVPALRQGMHGAGDPPGRTIDANECLYCMHCQVLYQDDKCPVCIKRAQRRAPFRQPPRARPRRNPRLRPLE